MSKKDVDLKDASNRTSLCEAAARLFLQDEQLIVNIAGVATEKFVQGARKAYKASGFNFTDSDLRMIHNMIRTLVVEHKLGQKPEVVH